MHVTKHLLILIPLLGTASARRSDAFRQISVRQQIPQLPPLVICPASNGCKCAKGTKQGQYCAACAAVTLPGTGGKWDHVFECNADGECCDYGYALDCGGEKPEYRCGDRLFSWE